MRYLLTFFIFVSHFLYSQGIINVPDQYNKIQFAIDATIDGDMIIVRPGIYYENINFKGKNISLVSEHYFNLGDTQLIKDTIIDGGKKGTVVRMQSGEMGSRGAMILGFTIQNGLGTGTNKDYTSGGGININTHKNIDGLLPSGTSSSPDIRYCIFKNNDGGDGNGSAIHAYSKWEDYGISSPKISNCVFYDNVSPAVLIDEGVNGQFYNITMADNDTIGLKWKSTGVSNIQSSLTIYNSIILDSLALIDSVSAKEIIIISSNGNPFGNKYGKDNTNIDPLFCYREIGEYSLHSNSPLVSGNLFVGALGVGCYTPYFNQNESITISEDSKRQVVLSEYVMNIVGMLYTSTTAVPTFSAESVSAEIKTSVNDDTLTITPDHNWNGTSEIKVTMKDIGGENYFTFQVYVAPVNDSPLPFEWVYPVTLDTVQISGNNSFDWVTIKWTKSIDPDGNEVMYWFNLDDTYYVSLSDTTYDLSHSVLLANWYYNELSARTFNITITAMDLNQNSAVVPINGGSQKLFVNRYQFLSTTDDLIPKSFKLYQNSPNPFNPNTHIRFDLPENESISLMIYNVIGKEVAQMNRNNLSAGSHVINWKGQDQYGERLPSGLYIYRLVAGNKISTKKMLLLK